MSAALCSPTACAPRPRPRPRPRRREWRAHTQDVLEGRVLVVLGQTQATPNQYLSGSTTPARLWGLGAGWALT